MSSLPMLAAEDLQSALPAGWLAWDRDELNTRWRRSRYIRYRFTCGDCGRWWFTVKGSAEFKIEKRYTKDGSRFFYLMQVVMYRQECKKCDVWGEPTIEDDRFEDIIDQVIDRYLHPTGRPATSNNPIADKGRGDHDSSRCEACMKGCCSADPSNAVKGTVEDYYSDDEDDDDYTSGQEESSSEEEKQYSYYQGSDDYYENRVPTTAPPRNPSMITATSTQPSQRTLSAPSYTPPTPSRYGDTSRTHGGTSTSFSPSSTPAYHSSASFSVSPSVPPASSTSVRPECSSIRPAPAAKDSSWCIIA